MSSKVRRVYVEKKPPYAVKAGQRLEEIRTFLGVKGITSLRLLIRYDCEDIRDDVFETACRCVFSEPPVDVLFRDSIAIPEGSRVFAVEALPGQFDQRADSAVQCIQLLNPDSNVTIRTAEVYILEGAISDEEFARIKKDVINPVDSRETSMEIPDTLKMDYPEAPDVRIFAGFTGMAEKDLQDLYDSLGLAMTFRDFQFIQDYFKNEEHRDPTMTEIRVLDTYWSDHCRHTTFATEITDVTFDDGYYKVPMETTFQSYQDSRAELFKDRPDKYPCLMDLALIGARKLKAEGKLTDQEESDENNACSVVVPIEVDYGEGPVREEWLLFFKNETHNHPTEIEPFGGAATCLGGAIRDPLSGRGYVYQAMRVTGAADPTRPVSETLEGKLPQKKLVTGAAQGYSSYGNQIGLATGEVTEFYHPGYVAKRMEIGAVMGAAARKNVIRENSAPGDVIILLGGRTGRDGMGGATGASKAHTEKSLSTCGAEVQKGNAPTERKLQRLFRRPEVSHIIKKCNDFGAGGVSVAIGELADGLQVNLDLVPKKYEGLDGTELAISESQERMAVVVDPKDQETLLRYAAEENLEATPVAVVTKESRLVLNWRGRAIVDISRAFLNTNGAHQETKVEVEAPKKEDNYFQKIAAAKTAEDLAAGKGFSEAFTDALSDLNVCSQKGLVERFDSSIGAATEEMPYGGKYQLTKTQAMTAKLPVLGGTTGTVSMMAFGFDPYLSSWSPYHGAVYAVTESVAKLIATGGSFDSIHFTFQEYFKRMNEEPTRWSQPFSALLGAYDAQVGFGKAAIGGKDSMSGSFEDLDVPPTLVSFAVALGNVANVTSPEFKAAGHRVVRIAPSYREDGITPDATSLLAACDLASQLAASKAAAAVSTPGYGATAEALFKMCVGNGIGVDLSGVADADALFAPAYGSFLVELADGADLPAAPEGVTVQELGTTTQAYQLAVAGQTLDLAPLQEAWEARMEPVFPYREAGEPVEQVSFHREAPAVCAHAHLARPRVVIPVFPGNNCEYDSAHAFERAGADVTTLVVNNLTPQNVAQSTQALVEQINKSQIIMIPGGFSGGDEPDGSAKFITAFFRAPAVTEAVRDLLQNRDGLILGICNGFQALVKLGLVPYGDIVPMTDKCPTLTFNTIGRHQSRLVRTRVASDLSPWLSKCQVGDIHTVAISHGEGRFVASPEVLAQLRAGGQIATQYVDEAGVPSMDLGVNPNGSVLSIEGITSPDGRVLGKMGHTERYTAGTYQNVPGNPYQPLFQGGVSYFTE